MKFTPAPLDGVFVIEPELLEDDRGFFARAFCANEFAEAGLCSTYVQHNIAWNRQPNTLRGLHMQFPPHSEVKVVTCLRGRVFDVIIDLRPRSPTFMQHLGIELSGESRSRLYVPEGFVHGYQTLTPDTELLYLHSRFFAPGDEFGVRWDDPAFAVQWPLADPKLSQRDRTLPDFDRAAFLERGG